MVDHCTDQNNNSVWASVKRQILASQKEALARSKYSIRVHVRETGPEPKPICMYMIVPTTLATNLAVARYGFIFYFVFDTNRPMGQDHVKFHKLLATKLAEKDQTKCSEVM